MASPGNSSHATMRTVIEPEGDLGLAAGEGDYITLFIVCSTVLSRASRVLDKMLHGGFTESKELQPQNSEWIVRLPDDDPDALEVFLNIAHNRFQHVSSFGARITPKRLYDLTVLADKYDLTHLLRPWVQGWLDAVHYQSVPPNSPFPHERLWISWVLGDQDLFKLMAKALAINGSPSYDNDENAVTIRREDILDPPEIFDMIYNTRLNTISALFALIQGIIDGLISRDTRVCQQESYMGYGYGACEPSMIGNMIRSLHFEEFWPIPDPSECDRSVFDVASRLRTLKMLGRDGSHQCSCLVSTQSAINKILDETFVDLADWQLHHLNIQGMKSGLAE
ncbi:hypothetical protein F5X99DRAFT_416338 [Biscogniauxia marginata]|nr:hypothetical protein F5X99DRAFT_416338 [Biscogniauxia marginata]